jgi:hypothetical protein
MPTMLYGLKEENHFRSWNNDGHAHHNSGACCPMPLFYLNLKKVQCERIRQRPVLSLREWCETAASLRFKEGVHIRNCQHWKWAIVLPNELGYLREYQS